MRPEPPLAGPLLTPAAWLRRFGVVAITAPWVVLGACQNGADSGVDPGKPSIPSVENGEKLPEVGGQNPRSPTGNTASKGPSDNVGAAEKPRTAAGSASLASQIARIHTALEVEDKAAGEALAAAIAAPSKSMFATMIANRYKANGNAPLFADDGALTAAADKLVEVLLDADAHALPAEHHDRKALETALKKFADARIAVETVGSFDDPSDKAIWDLITKKRGSSEADIGAAARELGLSDNDLGRLEKLRSRVDERATANKAYHEALGGLDTLLVERLHRFAWDMRFALRAHPFRADRSDAEGIARAGKDFETWLAGFFVADGVDVDGLVKAATPGHPDYVRTVAARAHYRQLAARYPTHLELDKDVEKLRRGRSGPAVAKLAERLQQEGYFEGEIETKFGPTLEAAVVAYQQTHQLKDSGEVDRIMRQSMNRTFAERADQLALSLQRLRESDLHQGKWRFGDARIRGRVNIPAFEAYFYIDGVEARRHRVVVGNNSTDSDAKTGKKGKLNQTRLFSAEMATVVLNPTWNVPRRIKEQELDLLLMEEPDYYAKNNFQVKVLSDGTEMVVQQPGPGNALGLVKFLFPNEYAIYMHDTPSKKLFARPVRAFSHGCMRTENPLDLARWLLVDTVKRLTNEKFDEVLESRQETSFGLDPKIPMSTDYATTGFDDKGRLVFYADVYGFDKDLQDGKTPYRADKDHPNTLVF